MCTAVHRRLPVAEKVKYIRVMALADLGEEASKYESEDDEANVGQWHGIVCQEEEP